MSKNAKKSFINGAMILMIALAATKIIGFVYKIPLADMLKGNGSAYYNIAYQIYSLLFILSTGGIPVAISKLVSESNALGRVKEPKKILKIAIVTFSIVGLIGTLILLFGARFFASVIFNSESSTISIIAIAPAILFVSVSSVLKGYFQGYKNMTPTAIFQIIEAATKLLGLGIVLALIFNGYSERYDVLSCGAILGVTLGAFLSMVFMALRFFFGKEEIVIPDQTPAPNRKTGTIFKAMIKIAIPVTISASALSLTSFIDTALIMQSLGSSGLATAEAEFVYGSYSMCCFSLFNLPPTLTQTIGISVFPFISELFSQGKIKEAHFNMDSSMRIVSLIAAPCALGLSVFSKPILSLIYSGIPDEVNAVYQAFTILSLAIYLVAMVYPTNLFLQGSGHARIPMISMIIGAVFKIVINIVLVSNPNIRINGAPFGTIACYGIIFAINLFMLFKTQKYKPEFKSVFLKPIGSALIAVAAAYGVHWISGGGKLMTLICILLAAVLYVVFILLFRTLTQFDIKLLPKGEKICSFLVKKGLVK